MVETATPTDVALAGFAAELALRTAESAGAEPAWLVERRRAAFERFERMGLPGRKHEEWRSTNVAPIVRAKLARATPAPPSAVDAAAERIALPWRDAFTRLVLVDGFAAPSLAHGLDAVAAKILPLDEAVRSMASRVGDHLGLVAAEGSGPFAQLNGALFGGGAALCVPRGRALDRPIEIVHVLTRRDEPIAVHPRTLVVLEEGARATLVERFVALDGARGWVNAVTEIVLAEGAALDRVVVEEGASASYHLATSRARVGRDARFTSRLVTLGASLARDEVHAELVEPGAECTLEGLYVATGERHVDCRTLVDHAAPHGTSEQSYRGILGGSSRGVFGGDVLVREDAQKTSARQSNKNLLLSRDASADTRPGLSILADDVQCSHGATVGELDEQELFYLRSRGLDEPTARALLILGFARAITRRIDPPELRAWIEERALRLVDGSLAPGALEETP